MTNSIKLNNVIDYFFLIISFKINHVIPDKSFKLNHLKQSERSLTFFH